MMESVNTIVHAPVFRRLIFFFAAAAQLSRRMNHGGLDAER